MNNEEKKFAHNTLSLKKDYDCLIKSNHQVWLFGYGSLLWKVDNFEYDKMIYGCVRGYRREFWLLSDDHRGTAQKMGRVLTLVKDEEACVYGIAYRIKSDDMEKTFEDLNFREKCGYSLKQVDFSPISLDDCNKFEPIKTVCYYANEKNVYYSPLNDPQKISKQIYETSGPSGTNKEYLFKVCDSLREMANCINDTFILKHDTHLFQLEQLVKELDSS